MQCNLFFKYKNYKKNILFLLHISSSYAKIWGETKFQPQEFPRSGSKAIDIEERREERKLVITMVSSCCLNQKCWLTLLMIHTILQLYPAYSAVYDYLHIIIITRKNNNYCSKIDKNIIIKYKQVQKMKKIVFLYLYQLSDRIHLQLLQGCIYYEYAVQINSNNDNNVREECSCISDYSTNSTVADE